LLQTFMVDPQRNWLVTGTSRGFITCWDIRFHIPVHTWRHPSKGRIYRFAPYLSASSPHNSWVYISTPGRDGVSVWDLESTTCKSIFRVLNSTEEEPPLPPVRPVPTAQTLDYGLDDLQIPPAQPGSDAYPYFVRGLVSSPTGSYLVSGASDKRVRFWDLLTPSNSCTVSGLKSDDHKLRYASSPTVIEGVQIYEEYPESHAAQFRAYDINSTPSPMSSNPSSSTHTPSNSNNTSSSIISSKPKNRGPPLPSPNHTEAILDVNLIELPHPMIVSCSREGVVKVWK